MSQIIKLEQGKTIPMFKYSQGEIESDRLIKAISTNLDGYLASKDWSNKKKDRFKNSVNKFITGIQNNNITEMSPIGSFEDTRGEEGGGVSNNTGNKRFKEDREAATFIKWVLDAQNPYKKSEPKKEIIQDFNLDEAFAKEFNKRILHKKSNTLDSTDLENISPSYKGRYRDLIFDTLSSINSQNWGLYENKDNYIKAITEAKNRLGNLKKDSEIPVIDMYKSELTQLGLNPGFLSYLLNQKKEEPTLNTISQDNTSSQNNTSSQDNSTNQNTTPNNSQQDAPQQNTIDYTSYLWSNSIQNWWNQNKNKFISFNLNNPNRYSKDYFEESLAASRRNKDAYFNTLLSSLANIDYSTYEKVAPNSISLLKYDSTPGNSGWKYTPQSYKFVTQAALDYLIKTNDTKYITKLDDGIGYAIMPTLSVKKGGSGLITVYNPNSNKLMQVPAYLLLNESKVGPYIKQQIQSPTVKTSNIPYNKEGGILKFQNSGQIPSKYINWDFTTRYKHALKDGKVVLTPRITNASDLISPQNGQYDPEDGGKEVESQPYWTAWTQALTNNQELGKSWADDYMKFQIPYQNVYQDKWYPKGEFNYNIFKTSNLWNDGLNGPGHDVYKGKAYRIKGTDTYGTLEDLQNQGYVLKEDTKPIAYNPLIDVYELEKSDDSNSSNTNSVVDSYSEKNREEFNNQTQRWTLPVLGSLLRYNNIRSSNFQLLKEALDNYRPYYKNPKRYELSVTGDYGSKMAHYNNAAQLNNKAQYLSSSDDQVNSARALEAERYASAERIQGDLADSSAIKQSAKEANQQAMQNMIWEVDNTNENAYNQWNSNLLRSQAKQGYIAKNSANFNTLIQELQNLYQQKQNLRTDIDKKAIDAYIQSKYSDNPEIVALTKGLQDWVSAGKPMIEYPEYTRLQQLSDKLNKEKLQLSIKYLGNLYGVGSNQNLINAINPIKPIKVNKDGGHVSKERIAKLKNKLDSQKLFQKNVLDYTKENSKVINNLSNTMQKLLMQVIKK